MDAPKLATATPPQTDDIRHMYKQATEVTGRLANHISDIDDQLEKIDQLLNIWQPPQSGKIRIEWWKKNGVMRPMPVVWKKTKKRTWRAEPVSEKRLVLRAKTARAFEEGSGNVQILLRMAADLLGYRVAALNRLANYARTTGAVVTSNAPRVRKHGEILDAVIKARGVAAATPPKST